MTSSFCQHCGFWTLPDSGCYCRTQAGKADPRVDEWITKKAAQDSDVPERDAAGKASR